jgi:hypothetical protein
MLKIVDECYSCDLPCIDCGMKHVKYYLCDMCGEELPIFEFDGGEYCAKCIEKQLTPTGDKICDNCGWEQPVYEFEGEELCIDCIIHELNRVDE